MGEYCDFPDSLCGAGNGGSCKPMPKSCTSVLQPVCGCDNKSYGNLCEAHKAGESVKSQKNCGG
jgi:hypothetical protein